MDSDAGAAQSNLNAGTKNPRVLPLPVFATPITSRPCRAGGQAWPWMGDGVAKPAAFSEVYKVGNKGASSNLGKQESQPPATVMSRSRRHRSTSGGLSKSFFKEDKSPPRFFGCVEGMENCGGGFPMRDAAMCACTASHASWASSGKVWAEAPSTQVPQNYEGGKGRAEAATTTSGAFGGVHETLPVECS